MSRIREIVGARELVLNFTLREIRGKYKRTVLGNFWSLLNPLAAMIVYTLVFSFILRFSPGPGDPSGLDVFALWLLCGLLPWNFLSATVTTGMGSLIADSNLIKKVWFPREVVVLSTGLSWLFTHLIELALLAAVLIVFGAFVVPWLPGALLVTLLLAMFAVGLALMLSVANVYFRDTQHFVAIGIQLWFYLTPIIYPAQIVYDRFDELREAGFSLPLETIYSFNPMLPFVESMRNLLYDNRWPETADLLTCAAWGCGALVIGFVVFGRHADRLVEEL